MVKPIDLPNFGMIDGDFIETKRSRKNAFLLQIKKKIQKIFSFTFTKWSEWQRNCGKNVG